MSLKSTPEIAGHSNRVQSIKFNPNNGNELISGGWDNCLILYDLRTESPVMNIIGPHICGDAIDIRKKDNVVVTASYV